MPDLIDKQTIEHVCGHIGDARLSAFGGRFCTWSVAGESLAGPWDLQSARPFRGEPMLTAAPLVHRREGTWALLGFRNLEPDASALEVVDPIPVALGDGELIDLRRRRGRSRRGRSAAPG